MLFEDEDEVKYFHPWLFPLKKKNPVQLYFYIDHGESDFVESKTCMESESTRCNKIIGE